MTHSFSRLQLWGISLMRWRCRNCGMKIGHGRAAQQLEGLPCKTA